jgi:hypothetical protein
MRSKGKFPKVVKNGSIVVKIHRLRHPITASGWVYAVSWSGPQGRKMSQFAEENQAMEEAR